MQIKLESKSTKFGEKIPAKLDKNSRGRDRGQLAGAWILKMNLPGPGKNTNSGRIRGRDPGRALAASVRICEYQNQNQC